MFVSLLIRVYKKPLQITHKLLYFSPQIKIIMLLKKVLLFSSLFVLYQCGGEETSTDTQDKTDTNTSKSDTLSNEKESIDYLSLSLPENPIIVERIYATSTQLPLIENSIYNAFDKDEATSWNSIPGATTNEGILIAFEETPYIKSFELKASKESEFVYYVNGSIVDERWGKTGKARNLNRPVKTIFIKFRGANDKLKEISSEEDETYKTYRSTDKEESLSLSEISFTGKDGNPLNIVLPYLIDGTVKTSSKLKESDSYKGDNLFDNMREYAWVEGVEGNGIDEKVTINTQKGLKINAIKVWNGYQRSPSHYYANAKVKAFDFLSGNTSETINIEDKEKPQLVSLSKPIEGNEFELAIKEAHKGNSYEDLAISELTFYQDGYPVKIKTSSEEETVKANKANTNLWFLDRGFENTNEEGASATDISMNIRSNGTFVYYKDENCGAYCYEIIDGNWELIEADKNKVKITVFGKVFRPSASEEMYEGKMNMNSVKIFKDVVTITKKNLKGEKFIEEIIFP